MHKAESLLLHEVRNKIYLLDDRIYLEAILELYPEYSDQAFENYLRILHKKDFLIHK